MNLDSIQFSLVRKKADSLGGRVAIIKNRYLTSDAVWKLYFEIKLGGHQGLEGGLSGQNFVMLCCTYCT